MRDKDGSEIFIPEAIGRLIAGKAFRADSIGRSQARVLIFDDCVLKIAPFSKQGEETVEVMRWLEGRLPVPKVLCCERGEGRQYLLMSRVPGRMACDDYYMARPKELVARLAEALRMLWSVDICGCPRIRDMDAELEAARLRVENRLVDMEYFDPAIFGAGDPRDPEALLAWLERSRPPYEPVLSHGDLCLPNVFIDDGRVSGLIDLEEAGVGDRWRDIAICWRSLKWNAEGVYGGGVYPDIRPEMLFDALGIAPDPDKLKYYLLLDELL